jgi:hypothetical protein
MTRGRRHQRHPVSSVSEMAALAYTLSYLFGYAYAIRGDERHELTVYRSSGLCTLTESELNVRFHLVLYLHLG